ncbi:MAG: glycoside hydrolase family 13 protein [Bacteroidia bacterium]|nr:glycoside hydrolase family 13 protein [Bacteroidia bacterium]
MAKGIALIIFLCMVALLGQAQPLHVDRIDPPNWWVGMKHNKVELLLKGQNIADCSVEVPGDAPVKIRQILPAEHPNYLFLTLEIDEDAKPGNVPLKIIRRKQATLVSFPLLERAPNRTQWPGVDESDFIYLAMPDRFANGNEKNDIIPGMFEADIHRDSMFDRHGGDLQGVMNHLDYLEDMGVTALWLNPVFENNQQVASYHGYAITDHYRVDRRLGSNEDYQKLGNELRKRNMKLVKDLVFNHVGSKHFLFQELPNKDFIHHWDEYQRTNYRAPTLMDPYASEADRKIMSDGWFDRHMPDLNQQNAQLAHYLIQNTIWWVEYAGLSGLRIDTYAYSDLGFMADLVREVREEYPNLGVFGETWVHGVPIQAFFTENAPKGDKGPSFLPGVTDFQLHYAINNALTTKYGWTDGWARVYYALAQDFVYENPTKNVVFLDNHDLSRFYAVIGQDIRKWRQGIAFLLTTRGIPSLYYGTELLMATFAAPDGLVRQDFPGGWPGDKENKFTEAGRTNEENQAFDFLRILARYRKTHPVLQTGKLVQFVPDEDHYVYFRFNAQESIIVIMNSQDKDMTFPLERYAERLAGATQLTDLVTGEKFTTESVKMRPFGVRVMEVK